MRALPLQPLHLVVMSTSRPPWSRRSLYVVTGAGYRAARRALRPPPHAMGRTSLRHTAAVVLRTSPRPRGLPGTVSSRSPIFTSSQHSPVGRLHPEAVRPCFVMRIIFACIQRCAIALPRQVRALIAATCIAVVHPSPGRVT